MTVHTILVAPAGGHLFFRADFDGRRWFPHPTLLPFFAILPELAKIMGTEAGPDLVFSTFRSEELLASAPNDHNFAERCTTEVMCPVGDAGSPGIWTFLCFHTPDRKPIAGERFVVRQLGETIKASFPTARLEELNKPQNAARRELWVKRSWIAAELAPSRFRREAPPPPDPQIETDRAEKSAAKRKSALVKAASHKSAAAAAFNKSAGSAYAKEQAAKRAKAAK